MIKFVIGNILDSSAHALVNTVNTMGVMGKGIALQFKKQFPNNYKIYKEACENKSLKVGQLLVTEEDVMFSGKKIIINFPTKSNWRLPSEYDYIQKGLIELKKIIIEKKFESVAIPPLGAGNGGLDWQRVKKMIIEALDDLNCDIYLYEPTAAIQEVLNTERVKLTPARAMLLSVLYEMVRHGEFVSEFAAEKAAYFLQRFGAKDQFKLDYKPNFYGPYSGKVRHVLYYLNGSYIMGFSSKDKKPFDELSLVMEAEIEVDKYLNQPENENFKLIVQKTKSFLKGYYSPFGLELLSTIDFIKSERKKISSEDIINELENWSDRKRTLLANPVFVNKALSNINQQLA
jgi:O-acetyl-ADP-ribose deacetylase (regulator of RNase III)/uncharacterized protein YwgA